MIDWKKIPHLPVILIIIVLLSAGCTGNLPAGNITGQPAVSPVAITTSPALPPVTEVPTSLTLPPATTPEVTTPVTIPVATLTTKPIPPPTISSIYIDGASVYVYPLSFDSTGFPTKGNITVSGVIESLSFYPLKVVMRAQVYDPLSPDVPKATAFDTVTITPHGVSGFNLEMDDFVFNTRPDYATLQDTYNLTVMNVSVASP
ncbi:MAG: hypothetical protein WAK75_10265 [Methanoregula sp.]|uniref:hypothetical protein n=1 Tax=Methanoregula sp. TaxID=2052170 RepID=UPI003BB12D60